MSKSIDAIDCLIGELEGYKRAIEQGWSETYSNHQKSIVAYYHDLYYDAPVGTQWHDELEEQAIGAENYVTEED